MEERLKNGFEGEKGSLLLCICFAGGDWFVDEVTRKKW
jgi:hypothetical protein